MKKLLIYLGVIGVSLAVLPIQAEAGPHHTRRHGHGGHYYSHFTRHYYRYHHPYYYRGYGYRSFYPGYAYPYYWYNGPGAIFTFRFN